MIVYNKQEVKDQLTIENIYELVQDFGGDPEYTSFGVICHTICHNPPGMGSKKLYYYSNSGLFRCYTQCGDYFDPFELVIKVMAIQYEEEWNLNDAIRYVAKKFHIDGREQEDDEFIKLEDWKYLSNYDRIQDIELKSQEIILKEYDKSILNKFNYNIQLTPWINEGITQEILDINQIGFYPGGDQITIPHFDMNDRFIGLRGRTLCKEEAELYGKYRPLKIMNQMYNHPLGFNLYNLNHSKDNIRRMKKAIVFEGEKSSLLFQSYFGIDNDISVACCGSALSNYQVELLKECGVEEIIVAFDRQFEEIGDNEFQHLKRNLLKLGQKYSNEINISFIFDKNMITGYKDSPIDRGKDIFLQLFNERIVYNDTLR